MDKTAFFRPEAARSAPVTSPKKHNSSNISSSSGSSSSVSTSGIQVQAGRGSGSGGAGGDLNTSGHSDMHNDFVSMKWSSSGSVDTRDTMAELARKVEPVDRDAVEFAPFDVEADDLNLK